jgi:hypothetical protein
MANRSALAVFGVVFGLVSQNAISAPRPSASIGEPQREVIVPEKVYVPTGFDDNDLVEVVVSGNLPSSCYSAGIFTAVPFPETRQIVIKQEALYYPKSWCVMNLVPYRETVKVGVLDAANYEVVFVSADGTLVSSKKSVSVTESTVTARDQFTYAVVENLSIKRDPVASNEGRKVVLEGSLINSCMSLKEVRVVRNDPEVIEILPITESSASAICQPQLRPFEIEVDLGEMPAGEKLIHVRSLNGQALNRVVRF